MPAWAAALLPGRAPNSRPPAPADAANVMKSLRVIVLICPAPFFLVKGGASRASIVLTPPPFGSPAACPPLLKQAHGLCAPASRQVCLYRDAGAPAPMNAMVQKWRRPVHWSGGHL